MAAGLWDFANVETLYELPFVVLVNMAQRVHRNQFDPNEVFVSTLVPGEAWQRCRVTSAARSRNPCRREFKEVETSIRVEGQRTRMVSRIVELANLDPYPESIPIYLPSGCRAEVPNGSVQSLDPIDFVRAIAVSRVTMPQSLIGVSLGPFTAEVQALCFMVGANTICADNSQTAAFCSPALHQMESLSRLGLRVCGPSVLHH